MWTDGVLIAMVTVLGAILVELIRTRRKQNTVVQAVTPNHGSSLADAIGRIEQDLGLGREAIRELRAEQGRHGERLAGVEAVLGVDPRRRP
jgi:hypothetical protein